MGRFTPTVVRGPARCAKCGSRHDVLPRATDDQLECWDCWLKRENAAIRRQETIERKKLENGR